jgi:hypothetical protein
MRLNRECYVSSPSGSSLQRHQASVPSMCRRNYGTSPPDRAEFQLSGDCG